MSPLRPSAAALLLTLALAGCGGDSGDGDAAAATPTPSASGPSCPPADSATGAFATGLPPDFPTDFPAPPGAEQATGDDTDSAVVKVRFPSTLSLRDSVAFLREQLPAAGYEITGGDQEPHEADVVFAKGDRRGQLRVGRVDECTTTWLVQVVRPG